MGTLKDRYGNDVVSGSGEPVKTRYDDKETKSKEVNDVQDYASLGRRANATSPFSGPKEVITEEKRTEKETSSEPDSVAGKGARNLALEDKEESKPAPKKTPPKKAAPAKVSSGASGFGTDEKGIARRRMEGLKEAESEKERKKGQGLTPYAKGRSFTGSTDSWASMIKKAKEAKESGYKKGGTVSSASKRGDGIAQRGKTRGRMV